MPPTRGNTSPISCKVKAFFVASYANNVAISLDKGISEGFDPVAGVMSLTQ